jgi:hypothetical protein
MGICGEVGRSELLSVYLRGQKMNIAQLGNLVDRIVELEEKSVVQLRRMCPLHGCFPTLPKVKCITNIIYHEFGRFCSGFDPAEDSVTCPYMKNGVCLSST